MKHSFLIEHKKAPFRKINIVFGALAFIFLFGAFFQNNIKTVLADQTLWDMVKGSSEQPMLSKAESEVYTSAKDPRDIVASVIQIFLSFLAIVFIVLLILAGLKWMLARGDEAKATEALEQIKHAVIGLLIIFASYGITYYVFNTGVNEIMNTTF